MTIYSPEAFEFEAQLEEEYKESQSRKLGEAGQRSKPLHNGQSQPLLISDEDERKDIRFDILKKKR